MTKTPRFTLEPGGWYAMTMYPGYGNEPYRSPVEVHGLEALGGRAFDLSFYNVGYASGVQMMEKRFRTIHRYAGALVVHEMVDDDRTIIFEPLTAAWVSVYTPGFATMMIEALKRSTTLSQYKPG
ncbi:hypothetical protein [Sphingomonas rubra]|uniref:Uncharacterized protein n=1 Tax=Sphingomonas rubra TaxID=634430 RepID=A0A1I5TTK7_9SPHN|nr:hypothetical protein [Sphingomonas rubra]SFP85937.1 hypothetical protein SAMN04488241_10915 [Sphingomonas rubra]